MLLTKFFFVFAVLKDEPDDLTHLAPVAGDVCVPLDDHPFLTDKMLDDFLLRDSFEPLLTDEPTDPFISYRDSYDSSPQLLSPNVSKVLFGVGGRNEHFSEQCFPEFGMQFTFVEQSERFFERRRSTVDVYELAHGRRDGFGGESSVHNDEYGRRFAPIDVGWSHVEQQRKIEEFARQ